MRAARHGDGTTIARLGQRVGGVEVYGRELRVLLKPDLALGAIAGSLDPVADPPRVEHASFPRPTSPCPPICNPPPTC